MDKLKIFSELSKIDCSEHIEKKSNLSYLSWTWAIQTLEMWCDEHGCDLEMDVDLDKCKDGMVYTHVTINGIRKNQWLPVMDYKNKSIANPTSTDMNKAYMRCLVKNIARWGLGLYIYAGEDLPQQDVEMDAKTGEVKEPKKTKKELKAEEDGKKFREEQASKITQEQWNQIVAIHSEQIGQWLEQKHKNPSEITNEEFIEIIGKQKGCLLTEDFF